MAEIASEAKRISAEEFAIAIQKAEISILKTSIDVQAQIQEQLANMIREIQPYLGSNIDITL